jgi:hypothetical protein
MKQSFTLKIKPFSINQMFTNTRSLKTSAFRDWSYQVMHRLAEPEIEQKLQDLREEFDFEQHVYHLSLNFQYPKKDYIRKAGGISAKTHDLSNIEKPIIDLIFLPVYHKKPHPYGCKNLNIDDKYLTKMVSEKSISPDQDHYIHISIEIKELNNGKDKS